MLPVSGAAQLKAIGAAAGLRPISSQSRPYSQLARPGPKRSSGMKRFQRPSPLALSRISTRILRVGDARADLGVERLHDLPLLRVDVLVHEVEDALAQRLDLGAGLEVHRLGPLLVAGWPERVPAET